ncbi:hypothetical protein M405DRAFT_931062 [Rhizopogon salebrosus TDB-379]|nr:hypothetical protein M405DRAFT_931062 [Rhizopogon salebrosus TDB-379]
MDTNVILSSLSAVAFIIDSLRWTIVVPEAVAYIPAHFLATTHPSVFFHSPSTSQRLPAPRRAWTRRASPPAHSNAQGWIAAACLDEHAGRMAAARKLRAVSKSDDIWLEAARSHSIKTWFEAADLEEDVKAKECVPRKALEIPNSVWLWKETVDLKESTTDARILLSRAVEVIPLSVELWLALARIETPECTKDVLNKTRKYVPTNSGLLLDAFNALITPGINNSITPDQHSVLDYQTSPFMQDVRTAALPDPISTDGLCSSNPTILDPFPETALGTPSNKLSTSPKDTHLEERSSRHDQAKEGSQPSIDLSQVKYNVRGVQSLSLILPFNDRGGEQRISTANDPPNDLDSRPSSPSSVSPSYLRQSRLASHHRSHTTTDESTSHLLTRLITRNDDITTLLVVTYERPERSPTVPTLLTVVHSSTYAPGVATNVYRYSRAMPIYRRTSETRFASTATHTHREMSALAVFNDDNTTTSTTSIFLNCI